MPGNVTLSIDAMGGDNAPEMVIDGIAAVRKQLTDTRFLLFGDIAQLDYLVSKAGISDVVTLSHTADYVSNDEKPGVALRNGRNSSMRLAIDAVGDGKAAGIVSAGNTGALMAMAKFVLKTLPGIDRPAIASYFPTIRGEVVMLDLGANLACDADNLVQFAVMGEVFARNMLNIKKPTIGILNVGAEEAKGNQFVREAAIVLQTANLPIQFHGFVEGHDIGKGTVDVIVTDGFTGNITLKTIEGTAKLFGSLLKETFSATVRGKLGYLVAKPALEVFKMRMDPRVYNGAMFVGLNGICVKSHGGTDSLGFANAIQVAHDLITNSFNDSIRSDCAQLVKALEEPNELLT